MDLYRDVSIVAKCVGTVLNNMNIPDTRPTFTFEVYRSTSTSSVLLLKTMYPEPFPLMYEHFDIAVMVSNLYSRSKERTYHTCEELLAFTPECKQSRTSRKRVRFESDSVDTSRTREICQFYVNEYYRNCDKITSSYTKIAMIVCSDVSNISMNPLIWSHN